MPGARLAGSGEGPKSLIPDRVRVEDVEEVHARMTEIEEAHHRAGEVDACAIWQAGRIVLGRVLGEEGSRVD